MKKILTLITLVFTIVLFNKVNASAASVDIRSFYDEYTINDEGRMKNPYDNVKLTDFGIDYNSLKEEGVVTLQIKLTIQLKEVNDGYQHIFIYDNAHTTDGKLLDEVEIEHGVGYKNTNWNYRTETFYVTVDDLNDDDPNWIYIRYGAHGNKDHDWMNRDVTMEINKLYC